jgi:ergothioneine biosynthesis protein EgtB
MSASATVPVPAPLARRGASDTIDRDTLLAQFQAVRRQTQQLCQPLEREDYVVQSMADASPVKWHLAHATWFFETFILGAQLPDYRAFHPEFAVLFNSYYEAVGPRWPRSQRGMLSRPTVDEIFQYRTYVDDAIARWVRAGPVEHLHVAAGTLVLGMHHEQQHQELILTDLKHAWSANPLRPVYRPALPSAASPPELKWHDVPAGLAEIGHTGGGFAYDNESPRHRVVLHGSQLASRLVTNAEYLAFIEDGGYDRPELWLSDGWATRQANGWTAPLYWQKLDETWSVFTLAGFRPLDLREPVCHVSGYEADAFARWFGARLPTEAEWEVAAASQPIAGHFLEAEHFHPSVAPAHDERGPLHQLYGDVWQWTASPYVGYPGYRAAAGALGEYNGKFMCNQLVLRGASCATPRSHARATYRNFFAPHARWQFTGIRLAREIP